MYALINKVKIDDDIRKPLLLISSLLFLLIGCVQNKVDSPLEARKLEIAELQDNWARADNHNTRKKIVDELERCKAVDALISCNYTSIYFQSPTVGIERGFQVEDSVTRREILSSMDKFRNSLREKDNAVL
jgi:hypothetical protein